VWLETLLNQFPEEDRGQLYVNRFCEACDSLHQKNQITGYTVWKKNSSEDNRGVDITLDFGNKKIDYQITSSLANALHHVHTNYRHEERGKIRIIYVREGNRPLMKSVENLEREILRKASLNF